MPGNSSGDDKTRQNPHDPKTGKRGSRPEPSVPDENAVDLDDDQADSGPDRDRNQLGR